MARTPGGTPESTVEAQIEEWRSFTRHRRELSGADTDELEDHLRARIDELTAAGLAPDEAFLVAVKRLGSLDSLTREFARPRIGARVRTCCRVPPARGAGGARCWTLGRKDTRTCERAL